MQLNSYQSMIYSYFHLYFIINFYFVIDLIVFINLNR